MFRRGEAEAKGVLWVAAPAVEEADGAEAVIPARRAKEAVRASWRATKELALEFSVIGSIITWAGQFSAIL